MRTLSVQTRVAGTSVAILAVSLGAVVLLIGASTGDSARRDAERITTETAARFAVQTQADLDGAFATARDLGTTLSALRATGGTREQADEIERTLLERHEPYLGVWSGWEADAFDGQDASYVSDPASDVSGRYITYWFRDGTSIESAPLVDYGTPGVGDYYQVPLRTRQEKILDPYEYDVAGTTVLMTSVTVPITDEGEVVGVSGVDIALSQLQATMAEVQVYGTGSATLISTSGAVVASPETDSIGRPAAEAVLTLASEAEGGVVSTTASTASGEVLRVAAPVTLTDQDTWVLVVDVPMTAVLADANRLRSTILLVGGLFLLLAAVGALLSARRLVRPIDVLQRRLTEISEGNGDLTQRVDDTRDDEIGALARGFNRFIEKVAGTVREIGTTSLELGASATSLQDVAARLQRGTTDTAAQTAALAAAGQQVDDSVQTVAAGIEEMGVSAGEIAHRRPVLAPHLDGPVEDRWPALTQAVLGHGINAIFALPVAIAGTPIGALDLYRRSSGPPEGSAITGGVYAARLAALPLLHLMTAAAVKGARVRSGRREGGSREADLRLAQALADVATVALIRDRAASDTHLVDEQLQKALDRRVVLEQAKGVLSSRAT